MATKKQQQIQNDEETKYCVVCMGTLKKISRINCCDHTFCYECISKWAHKQLRCPICRKQFDQIRSRGRKILKFIERKVKVQNTVQTQQLQIEMTPIFFYTQIAYLTYVPISYGLFDNRYAIGSNQF